MSKFYTELNAKLQGFMTQQKIFFVATAGNEGRVNLSPKGMDSLRILTSNQLIWLNLSGSGNETAAHILENPRMTLMFCAFEGSPMILRVYGNARAIHSRDEEWGKYINLFPEYPGSRQIFLLDIESAQTSCGFAVPRYQYQEDREDLVDWAEKIGEDGVEKYWKEKNQLSIDGKPTELFK
ncbi:MAG: pyridoxamine 5'-phosphate oxidase family protein [Nitrospinae bacterium]|nr:pyridoxamine 5'-phosphate oxidase family protein [Nitrospinota bacterium]